MPGPQDSTFLAAASEGYIHTTRYCVSCREQFYTTRYCAYVSENSVYTTWYYAYVSENSSYSAWYCAYFQRTVFTPPGIVSALKRTSFYTKWYLKCLSENSFSTPPHSLASPDEVSTPGIVSRKSELSF